jgi:hypothetical protein
MPLIHVTERLLSHRILFAAILAGALQVVLSYLAGVHSEFQTYSKLPGFGYLKTTHWSVTYLILVPLVYLSSIHSIRSLFLYKGPGAIEFRGKLNLGLAVALIATSGFVGHELWDSYFFKPLEGQYCQWNNFAAFCGNIASTKSQEIFRLGLIILAYINHFLSFGVYNWFMASMICICSSSSVHVKGNQLLTGLGDALKVAVGAYLPYLILIRSSKTEIALIMRGEPSKCDAVLKWAECAQSYFETISGGLAFNLGLGMVLTLGLVYCLRKLSVGSRADTFGEPIAYLNSWEDGFHKLGKKFKLVLGITMIGIIIPPPTATMMLALALVLPGLLMVKNSTSHKDEHE